MSRRTTRHAGWVGDAEYGVTTVQAALGDQSTYCHKPCRQCPWRTDAPVGRFPAEAFRLSARTAYDMASNVFACHMAKVEQPTTCAGFLLRGADHNLSVRLSYIAGRIDRGALSDGGVPLYDSYRAMAEANGVDAADPVLSPCR